MRNSNSGFYQRGRLSDYQRTDEDERNNQNYMARAEDRSALPEPSEIQNRLRDANRFSQENRSPDLNARRAVTPNATTASYGDHEPLNNRVSYKPSYERMGSA